MMARAADNGAIPKVLLATSGVKRGSVFSAMLGGIRLANRTDGHLLNSRRTRQSTSIVHNLICDVDSALNTTIKVNLQWSIDLLAAECANFGLTINTGKTVFTHQPSPSTQHGTASRIDIDGNELKIRRNSGERTLERLTRSPKPAKPSTGCQQSADSNMLAQSTQISCAVSWDTFGNDAPTTNRQR
ncbi:hypothetical protein SprV_0802490600 [Sparganum proliferum]